MINVNLNFTITPAFATGVMLGALCGMGISAASVFSIVGALPFAFVLATMAYSAGFILKYLRFRTGTSTPALDRTIMLVGLASLLASVYSALSDDYDRMLVWLPINVANGVLIFADHKFWGTLRG